MGYAGQELDGRYELMEELGAGAMGVVYRGRHLKLPITYAIKLLKKPGEAHRARFIREAQFIAKVHHPGVVQVFDFGECADGTLYIVMELLKGENLHERMNRGGISQSLAVRLVVDLLGALQACHRFGLVHRDVKPSNVFLDQGPDGARLKLLDFGVAKQPGDEQDLLTGTGVALGTLSYMAPEQVQSSNMADLRCDVFAVAAILYRLLAGRSHVPLGDPREILLALMTGQYQVRPKRYSPEIPPWLDEIIARGLSPNRGERFESAGAFLKALLGGWGGSLPMLNSLEGSGTNTEETFLEPIDHIGGGYDIGADEALTKVGRSTSPRGGGEGVVPETVAPRASLEETRGYKGERAPTELMKRTLASSNLSLDEASEQGDCLSLELEPALSLPMEGAGEAVLGQGSLESLIRDAAPSPQRSSNTQTQGASKLRFMSALGGVLIAAVAGGGFAKGLWLPTKAAIDVPADMAYLPGGTFTMGSSLEEIEAALVQCAAEFGAPCPPEFYERETPQVRVTLPSFFMDRYEVTTGEFASWLSHLSEVEVQGDRLVHHGVTLAQLHPKDHGLRLRGEEVVAHEESEERPLGYVTYFGAAAYCVAKGKRLPSEAEWAFAARGSEGRRFPWGAAEPTCDGVSFELRPKGECGDLQAVPLRGSHPQDQTPEGIWDLGGGLMEWTASPFTDSLETPCVGDGCLGHEAQPKQMAVVRGGAYRGEAVLLRAASRSRGEISQSYDHIGFRCAASGHKETRP